MTMTGYPCSNKLTAVAILVFYHDKNTTFYGDKHTAIQTANIKFT